jgi:hypothetical protein
VEHICMWSHIITVKPQVKDLWGELWTWTSKVMNILHEHKWILALISYQFCTIWECSILKLSCVDIFHMSTPSCELPLVSHHAWLALSCLISICFTAFHISIHS